MALFNFGKKYVLLRCTECFHEYEISPKKVLSLEQLKDKYDICPVNELCPSCNCIAIPVNYTDSSGKNFTFAEIKQIINNLPANHKFFADPDDFYDQL